MMIVIVGAGSGRQGALAKPFGQAQDRRNEYGWVTEKPLNPPCRIDVILMANWNNYGPNDSGYTSPSNRFELPSPQQELREWFSPFR